MTTLRNNFKSVSSLIGFFIALSLLGVYLRGWWLQQGIVQDIILSTVAFMIVAVLAFIEVRSMYLEIQSRPSKK